MVCFEIPYLNLVLFYISRFKNRPLYVIQLLIGVDDMAVDKVTKVINEIYDKGEIPEILVCSSAKLIRC